MVSLLVMFFCHQLFVSIPLYKARSLNLVWYYATVFPPRTTIP
uniref:Uncharacterized protein n=1 Tax=Arundo donax TaxID=35708 RepID=A0A0A9EBQ5_ARUDO